jgi:hypothetical protein
LFTSNFHIHTHHLGAACCPKVSYLYIGECEPKLVQHLRFPCSCPSISHSWSDPSSSTAASWVCLGTATSHLVSEPLVVPHSTIVALGCHPHIYHAQPAAERRHNPKCVHRCKQMIQMSQIIPKLAYLSLPKKVEDSVPSITKLCESVLVRSIPAHRPRHCKYAPLARSRPRHCKYAPLSRSRPRHCKYAPLSGSRPRQGGTANMLPSRALARGTANMLPSRALARGTANMLPSRALARGTANILPSRSHLGLSPAALQICTHTHTVCLRRACSDRTHITHTLEHDLRDGTHMHVNS